MRSLIFRGFGEDVDRLESRDAFSRTSFRPLRFASLAER